MRLLRVDRHSPLPIYYQIKEWLREQIESEVLKPQDRIPSERDLEQEFGISRMTARRALGELEAEGYVYREQGRGSFVAESKIRQGLLRLTSFTEEMQKRGMRAGARVLRTQKVDHDKHLASRFGVYAEEVFILVERLRLANGKPMVLETAFLREMFCPGLEEVDLNNRSLYETLRERYGIQLGRAEQTVEARVADDYEAKVLEARPGTPVLAVERLTYLSDGKTPIEYVRSLYRGDRYRLFIELRR